jgi:heme/copper-type cytochrome/quinol oxidase subunit 4
MDNIPVLLMFTLLLVLFLFCLAVIGSIWFMWKDSKSGGNDD